MGSSILTYFIIGNYGIIKKPNTESIQRAISAFSWDVAFQSIDINDKMKILN